MRKLWLYNNLLHRLHNSQSRLLNNRFAHAIIASTMAIVPLSIVRGLVITASVICDTTGFNNAAIWFMQLQVGFLALAPLVMNIYVAVHWAVRNRLSQIYCIALSISTLMIFRRILDDNAQFFLDISIPLALASGVFGNYLQEVVSENLLKLRLWKDNSYTNIISFFATLGIIALFSCAIKLGAAIWLKSGMDFLNNLSMYFYPKDFLHGISYVLLRTVPWFFGLHGYYLFLDIDVAFTAAQKININDWHTLHHPLNILSPVFYDMWCNAGGTGNTVSLIICIFMEAKSPHRRLLGVAAPMAIFNINEPLIFGYPIVLNPVMIIPFVLVPLMSYLVAYGATYLDMVPRISEIVSWSTPSPVKVWLASGHSVSAVFLYLLIISLGVVIYRPFVTTSLKQSVPDNSDLDLLTGEMNMTQPTDFEMVPNYSHIVEGNSYIEAQRQIEKLQNSGQFILYFQPQVRLSDHIIVALEVLIRHQSDSGKITPPVFLKYYERTGLMPEMDFWVMEHALDYVRENMSDAENMTLSVNISPQTLVDYRLLNVVRKVLAKPLPTGWQLEFEITESQKVQEPVRVAEVLEKMRSLGIKIALDDFGSGYSTLHYLTRYPLDKIKLDRSMVLGLAKPDGFNFLRQVVKLCMVVKCEVLIEGVETQDELAQVQMAGIEFCQGYFFHRPLPGNVVCQLLTEQHKKMSLSHAPRFNPQQI
ncbi:EAL domain-containing protein [Buttiauxella agrestis]|uniref:Diguanylate cyclase/phosphodiesterase domain 2 n=1 Tax=Buttiauxella agrestis ATCC 33320 TaxID=1006004 RepID=A0A085G9D1_9ENTR|nr:EAL domain-containing protein [Buttiauxella agrestis]KFC80326.1 diguanylate cyclase/phosphodiesterase domain 2 [Buttiauxella agrestis ATCC 33320]